MVHVSLLPRMSNIVWIIVLYAEVWWGPVLTASECGAVINDLLL